MQNFIFTFILKQECFAANNIVAIVACSLLMKVLEKEDSWPTLIIQGE